jgi:hypothetical protein
LKSGYGGRGAAELGRFLLDRHARDQVIYAPIDRQRRIQVCRAVARGRLLAESRTDRGSQQNQNVSFKHGIFPLGLHLLFLTPYPSAL